MKKALLTMVSLLSIGLHAQNNNVDTIEYPIIRLSIKDQTFFISNGSKNENVFKKRAELKCRIKDYASAIEDYNKAIELSPKDATEFLYSTYFARALAKAELKDYEGAIDDFTKAIAQNPVYGSTFNDRGYSKYLLGNYAGAIE